MLLSLAPVVLFLVGFAAIVKFFNVASGWERAAKAFGPAPVATVSWLKRASYINGSWRMPAAIGACERGVVIAPLLPFALVTPVLWAPWDEIELAGPHWHWGMYEDLVVGGFELAVPRAVGERIRAMKRGWQRFDEPK